MLVINRKVGQEIVIGDNIVIRVVDVKNGNVRMGVTAPKEIRIDRQEIHELRRRENE